MNVPAALPQGVRDVAPNLFPRCCLMTAGAIPIENLPLLPSAANPLLYVSVLFVISYGLGDHASSSYAIFWNSLPSLKSYQKRQNKNPAVPEAELLFESFAGTSPSFEDVMQADFVLYLRALQFSDWHERWIPLTLVYASRRHNPFEIFARAESRKYLDRLLSVLGYSTLEDLKSAIDKAEPLKFTAFWGVPVPALANLGNLGSVA
jgi:hypothetical protein